MTESAADAAWLRRRWVRRFPSLGPVGDGLVSRYGAASRIYHDVRHLRHVLETLDLLAGECDDLDAVELAGWFHDAVYDVRRGDNEEASAALAEVVLGPRLDSAVLAEVVRLVLLTRDHAVPDGDRNGAVLCDADLVVLAGETQEYDAYAQRVRAEYADVSDEDFRAGRSAVLRGLLDLPSLFSTRLGRDEWEKPARANLARELASLV
ncbi:MAG: HD domain-containing protein [Nocardioidaceae bacterium]